MVSVLAQTVMLLLLLVVVLRTQMQYMIKLLKVVRLMLWLRHLIMALYGAFLVLIKLKMRMQYPYPRIKSVQIQ